MLLLTLLLLILFPLDLVKRRSSQRPDTIYSDWYYDYIGHITVASCFFVTWAFGLPAMGVLNTSSLQLSTQVIFIITSFLFGVLLVLCYCLFPQNVRKSIFCCCHDGIKDDERPLEVEENPYSIDVKDEGLSYENPLTSEDFKAAPPDYDTLAASDFDSKEDLGMFGTGVEDQGGTTS